MVRRSACLLLLFAFPALAADPEITIGPEAREALSITIYQDDLGFVRERRGIDIPAGPTTLAIVGLPDRAQPDTTRIDAPGLSIAEKSFQTEILSPQALLARSLGHEVSIVRVNPQTGAETTERARVVAIRDGVVLDIGGRIHTDPPGRIVFDGVPPGLRPTPALLVRAQAAQAGRSTLGLSYLTTGLAWRADYVLDVDPKGDRGTLQAWVDLTNQSGADFMAASLSIASGSIQRLSRMDAAPKAARAPMAMAAAAPAFSTPTFSAPESIGNIELARFERPIDLVNGQAKQVSLFLVEDVPFTKDYLAADIEPVWTQRAGAQRSFAAATITLKAEGRLNRSLPAGTITTFGKDGPGEAQLLGEQSIPHTPRGESLRLRLGADPDLSVSRVQTDFKRLAQDTSETGWEVRLRNAKAEPVTVQVQKTLSGEWQILEESLPHRREDARAAVWSVPVPAGGESVLRFTARIRN
jgi:hypothetical protein